MLIFGFPAWPLAAALLGLVAGSFANLCIETLARDEPFRGPLLRCGSCGKPRRLVGALPIAGWLMEGRCLFCRQRVSSRTPLVEAVSASLWFLLALLYGASPHAIVLMVLVTSLLILSLIDLRCYLLPDALTLPGIAAGVAATWLPGWPVSLTDSALSAAVGYFAMMALAKVAEMYYGREAIGQGDWKMVAMLGAFLGSTKLVATVLIANGTGAVVGLALVTALGNQGRQKLPLGTFLGASAIVMLFV